MQSTSSLRWPPLKRVVEAMAAAETLAAATASSSAGYLTEARKKLPDGEFYLIWATARPCRHLTRCWAVCRIRITRIWQQPRGRETPSGSVAGDVGAQSPLSALEKTLSVFAGLTQRQPLPSAGASRKSLLGWSAGRLSAHASLAHSSVSWRAAGILGVRAIQGMAALS